MVAAAAPACRGLRAKSWGARVMGYAAVLVHVDADADSDPRVRLARELAARGHAILIGAGAWALQSEGGGGIAGGEEHGSDGGAPGQGNRWEAGIAPGVKIMAATVQTSSAARSRTSRRSRRSRRGSADWA